MKDIKGDSEREKGVGMLGQKFSRVILFPLPLLYTKETGFKKK